MSFRLLNKDEIIIGNVVHIKGSDGKLHPLTIVLDDNYYDEDSQLAETEVYKYQQTGELFIPDIEK